MSLSITFTIIYILIKINIIPLTLKKTFIRTLELFYRKVRIFHGEVLIQPWQKLKGKGF